MNEKQQETTGPQRRVEPDAGKGKPPKDNHKYSEAETAMVLKWAAEGMACPQIARRLDRSELGIEYHIKRLVAGKSICPEIADDDLAAVRKSQAARAKKRNTPGGGAVRLEAVDQYRQISRLLSQCLGGLVGLVTLQKERLAWRIADGLLDADEWSCLTGCRSEVILEVVSRAREISVYRKGQAPKLPFEVETAVTGEVADPIGDALTADAGEAAGEGAAA